MFEIIVHLDCTLLKVQILGKRKDYSINILTYKPIRSKSAAQNLADFTPYKRERALSCNTVHYPLDILVTNIFPKTSRMQILPSMMRGNNCGGKRILFVRSDVLRTFCFFLFKNQHLFLNISYIQMFCLLSF